MLIGLTNHWFFSFRLCDPSLLFVWTYSKPPLRGRPISMANVYRLKHAVNEEQRTMQLSLQNEWLIFGVAPALLTRRTASICRGGRLRVGLCGCKPNRR